MKIFKGLFGFDLFWALIGGIFIVIFSLFNFLTGKYNFEEAVGLFVMIIFICIPLLIPYLVFSAGIKILKQNDEKKIVGNNRVFGIFLILISIVILLWLMESLRF